MQNRAKILTIVTFASTSLLALGFGVAQAQGGASGASGGVVTGTVGGTVPLSPDEIQKQAASAMGRIEMAAMDVQGKLQKATDEGDAVKVDCLSDKLSVIRTREKAAKDRLPLLEGALRVKDTDQAATFLLVIQKHREESEKAQAQAAGCIGSDLSFLGETKSTMTRDPELPQDNGQPPAFLDTPGWGMDMPPASDPSASL